MKIAMIGQKGIPAIYGGVERHVEVLSYYLAARGHKVFVYSRKWYSERQPKPRVKKIKRVPVCSIHTKSLDTITGVSASVWHALRQDYDVIHFHGVGAALLAWIPRLLKPRVRVIVTVHSLNRVHPQWGCLARIVLRVGEWASVRFPHKTIVVSRGLKIYFKKRYNAKVFAIPNGVYIPTRKPSVKYLSKWKLKKEGYLIFVGRLVQLKGVHTAVAAWKRLKKKNSLGNLKLVIVGDANFSEKYVKSLRSAASKDESIIFTGWQDGDKLNSLIAHASLFVQPSLSEGLPIALLEAMSFGLPALVSNIPAHRELITQKEVRFPVEDEKALAKLLLHALDNPKWRKDLGGQNLKKVQEEYKWEVVVDRTLGIYEESF